MKTKKIKKEELSPDTIWEFVEEELPSLAPRWKLVVLYDTQNEEMWAEKVSGAVDFRYPDTRVIATFVSPIEWYCTCGLSAEDLGIKREENGDLNLDSLVEAYGNCWTEEHWNKQGEDWLR